MRKKSNRPENPHGQWHGNISSLQTAPEEQPLPKELREQIRQSDEIFRLMVSSVKEYAIFMLSPEGDVLTWNKGAERIKGYRAEEILGHSFSCFYTQKDIDLQKPQENLLTACERGFFYGEGWRVRKDGSLFWADVTITPLYEANGKLRGFAKVTHDISERKQAEEALRISERLERATLDALSAHVAILDGNGTIIAVNARWRAFADANCGGSAEGTNYLAVCDSASGAGSEEAARFANGIRSVLQGRLNEFSLEYPCHSPNEKRWFIGRVTRFTSKNITRLVVAHENITERKEAEDVLRDQASLLNLAHDAIIVRGTGDVITFWNDGAEATYGWSWLEAVGRVSHDLLKTCFPKPLAQLNAELTTQGGWEGELIHTTKNGKKIVVASRWAAQRDTAGSLVDILEINRDITLRKDAEAKLRDSEQRLALALESGQMGMWEWDLRTSQSVWNAKEYELLGLPEGDGRPPTALFFQHVHPVDVAPLDRSLKEAQEEGRDWRHEFRIVREDGQVRWLVGTGRCLRSQDGQVERMVGVNYDTTERKEAEAALTRSKLDLERLIAERTAKLEELVGELEHFSYSIVHDMRAPLRAMRGFSEILDQLCSDGGQVEQKALLQRIMTSADRMDSLIRDALHYSRALRQKMPLEPVDLSALLRGMLDSYPELQSAKAHIQIENDLPMVMANQAGLTQCFSNLLGNAVKFAKPGQEPKIRVWAKQCEPNEARSSETRKCATSESRSTRICVEDNGIGIPKAMLPRVFDMFCRGHGGYEGTGIGLALVQKVVNRMGGRVGVWSEEGKGSRFWMELKVFAA